MRLRDKNAMQHYTHINGMTKHGDINLSLFRFMPFHVLKWFYINKKLFQWKAEVENIFKNGA